MKKPCPRKRTCYHFFVIFAILEDITVLLCIIVGPYFSVQKMEENHPAKDDLKVAHHIALRLVFSFWAYYFVLIYKIFLAVRWSCNPDRTNLQPYYRWTITSATMNILGIIPFVILAIDGVETDWNNV